MENIRFEHYGKKVSFIDSKGISRVGIINTFPFNNTVDIKEEKTGNNYSNISAKEINPIN